MNLNLDIWIRFFCVFRLVVIYFAVYFLKLLIYFELLSFICFIFVLKWN